MRRAAWDKSRSHRAAIKQDSGDEFQPTETQEADSLPVRPGRAAQIASGARKHESRRIGSSRTRAMALDFPAFPAYGRLLQTHPMNPLARLLLPAAALFACAAAPLSAADAVELKQRWIAGKQYLQTMQSTQGTTMTIGPQKIEQKTVTTMDMSMAVRAHEDGQRKRVTIKYDRVAMQMEMNGQKMGFDSAKPGEGTDPLGLSKTLGATVGKELKVILTPTDEVGEVENFDEFVKNLAAAPMPGMDMSKMFTKESMAQMMKQGALQSMPGKPVKPGDSCPSPPRSRSRRWARSRSRAPTFSKA